MKRLLLIGAASLMLLTACNGSSEDSSLESLFGGKKGKDNELIVAKVGDKDITAGEFVETMLNLSGDFAINELVSTKIIEIEAEKAGINVTEEEVQFELDKTIEEYGNEDIFNQQLSLNGMTLDDLKKNITRYVKMRKLVSDHMDITEDDLVVFYNENKSVFNKEEKVLASHILVEDEETARDVYEKAVNGEDFATLAKEHSIDEGTKEEGGDLGFFSKGEMIKEFEDVAFSIGKGSISEPFKTDYGYHIMKVFEVTEGKEFEFEEVKEDVRDAYIDTNLEIEYSKWIEEMKEKYGVEIYFSKEK